MRIIICDDSPSIREKLSQYIREYFNIIKSTDYEIAEYASGDALLEDAGPFDIVFLDIEMPGIDGIVTGSRIKEVCPKSIIIVVTSFSEYLDSAMKISVFRYLSKPIDKHRLFRNLSDAVDAYINSHTYIAFETTDGCIRLDTDSIVMVESLVRRVKIITQDTVYETAEKLSEIEHKLTLPCFYRCHRSFIINMKHVSAINKDTVYLLGRRYQAYLSRRKYSECRNRLLLCLEQAR